jgi:hypothetical protein
MQQQRADRQLDADVQPLLQLLPGPVVHADLAAAAALPAAGVEVSLGERERLVNAQPGSPEHDDQPAQAEAVGRGAGLAHDGDDLLDGGWVGGIPAAFVARRSAGVEARHRGRGSATAGSIEQHVGHDTLLTIGSTERDAPLGMETSSPRCSSRRLRWSGERESDVL